MNQGGRGVSGGMCGLWVDIAFPCVCVSAGLSVAVTVGCIAVSAQWQVR